MENIENDTELANTKNYNEALNDYFKLKKKYEDEINDAKKQITKKELNKKIAFKKKLAIRPKCVHCKRPVGTLFSSKERKFIAICGDRTNPCTLNIEIYRGGNMNIDYLLDLFKEDINNLKENIIQQKLDTLLNYVSEQQSVSLFKKELKAYNGDSLIYKEIQDRYNSLYDNDDKRVLISQKNEELFGLIEKSRGYIEEYKKTNINEFLKLSIETNIKEIMPLVENIRLLKNEVTELVVTENKPNSVTPTYTVFKYPVLLSKIDYSVGEPPRIAKYTV